LIIFIYNLYMTVKKGRSPAVPAAVAEGRA